MFSVSSSALIPTSGRVDFFLVRKVVKLPTSYPHLWQPSINKKGILIQEGSASQGGSEWIRRSSPRKLSLCPLKSQIAPDVVWELNGNLQAWRCSAYKEQLLMKETQDGSCYRTITTCPLSFSGSEILLLHVTRTVIGTVTCSFWYSKIMASSSIFQLLQKNHESIITKEGPETQIEIHVYGSTEPKNLIAGSGDQILPSGRKRLDCSKWKVMKSSGGAGGGVWPCLKINPVNGVTERLWLEQMPHKYWNPLFFKEIGPNSMRGRYYSDEQKFSSHLENSQY